MSTIYILKKILEPITYPRRVLSPEATAGLNIVFTHFKKDNDYICRGPVQGFKIILHTPGEIPRVSKQYYRAPINQEVILSVEPKVMITDEELYDYAPEW